MTSADQMTTMTITRRPPGHDRVMSCPARCWRASVQPTLRQVPRPPTCLLCLLAQRSRSVRSLVTWQCVGENAARCSVERPSATLVEKKMLSNRDTGAQLGVSTLSLPLAGQCLPAGNQCVHRHAATAAASMPCLLEELRAQPRVQVSAKLAAGGSPFHGVFGWQYSAANIDSSMPAKPCSMA